MSDPWPDHMAERAGGPNARCEGCGADLSKNYGGRVLGVGDVCCDCVNALTKTGRCDDR